MAAIIKDTFSADLAVGGTLTADTSNPNNNSSLALDGKLDTWWEAAAGRTNGTVTLSLPQTATFDVISLQEAVDHRGQRIESFAIEIWNGADWMAADPIPSDELTTVGHRRLIRLKSPVTTDKVRIRINRSRLEPTLAEIGLFRQSAAAIPPTISDRSANGSVTITNNGNRPIVYTVDGSAPTANSTVYLSPISVAAGATIQAGSLLPDGHVGLVASKTFAGSRASNWKIVSVDSQETTKGDNGADKAIDGNASTFWHTRFNDDLALPHFITVDMGASRRIGGFTYLPRQDGNPNGVVENYRFETSKDGTNWVTNIISGTFANIRNNPSLQEVPFATIDARFFRFTALREINRGGWASAAEISVLAAERATEHWALCFSRR